MNEWITEQYWERISNLLNDEEHEVFLPFCKNTPKGRIARETGLSFARVQSILTTLAERFECETEEALLLYGRNTIYLLEEK